MCYIGDCRLNAIGNSDQVCSVSGLLERIRDDERERLPLMIDPVVLQNV